MESMGIGYKDRVVVYNRSEENGNEYFFGTRFDRVRIELTQGAVMRTNGIENASECVVKIPCTEEILSKYLPPMSWGRLDRDKKQDKFTFDKDNRTFFVISQKSELGIDIDLPIGVVGREEYPEGFYEYLSNQYGYVYLLKTVDVFSLVPRFEISGS